VNPASADARFSAQTLRRAAIRVQRASSALASRTVTDGALRAFVVLCLLFLFLPVVLVVLFSFSSNAIAAFPFHGPSLKWYRQAFGDSTTVDALLTSFKLAALAGLAGTMLGTAAALAIVHWRRVPAAVSLTLIGLPLVLPALIIGIALASAFNLIGVKLSVWTALLGHTILVLPLAVAIVVARLGRFDWSVEEASRDLGAGSFYTFAHVVLPAIRPTLIGALAISMAFSLDEFVVTFFTIGIDNTLPIVLWSRMRTSIDPSINAIGSVILAGTMLLTAIAARFGSVKL
jgi:spermidine/putrescine transport system permease protein